MEALLGNRLAQQDPEIYKAIGQELQRQQNKIELIASENFTSPEVMAAQGSCLTNKYAEGYPGKRYYGGCEYVDVAEELARERSKKLFNCEYVNVQPHSGAQANTAVYFAMLKPGDKVMGMDLSRRTFDAWLSGQSFRGILPVCAVWCVGKNRDYRLYCAGNSGRQGTAENDRSGCFGLSAHY
ncbi:hypothetical protein RDn1_233 [Candidatus Termititenax dinenymphae]|uniref:Serine hydroxymethyltransferase-like domain-containing protein n=1 Tax=Candidatus Termititenax dinenymphae TaxID=2218523 RepID=A0A388TLN7_9BACT|nr:hypothetical protein RDn1_233 [Candidatus Termititenax dinenymphae]